MAPQAQTKTSGLTEDLWLFFIEGKSLNEFSRNRFRHEIKCLEKVDPDGFLILSALIAAIDGNEKEALDLADLALNHCNDFSTLLNWGNILINLGQIRKAFFLTKKSWRLAPENLDANKRLILLAAVVEDTETLALALETWHRLNPGQIYPLVSAYQLNQKDTPLFTLDDESILRILNCLQEESKARSPHSRLDALTRSLMQEIEA